MAARWRRSLSALLLAASVALAAPAHAAGRAGFRFTYPLAWNLWAEQTVWAVDGGVWRFESAVGVEYGDQFGLTPYSAVYASTARFWIGLQVGRSTGAGFRFSLLGGLSW